MTTTKTKKFEELLEANQVPELPNNIYLDRVLENIHDPSDKHCPIDSLEDWISFAKYLVEMNEKHDLSEAWWNCCDGWDVWLEDAGSIADKCKQWVDEQKDGTLLDGVFGYEWDDVVTNIRLSDPKLQEVPLQDLIDYWMPHYKLVADSFYGFKRVTSD